jgi:hypothetical protein
LLVPPDEECDRPEWGVMDCKSVMMPHYKTAKATLSANPSPKESADHYLREVGMEILSKGPP